jgi:hypothetical protein
MIGGGPGGTTGVTGAISHNEIGWRGEHPGAPDGCGIDYEAGSDGVAVTDNVIHDSYAAGVMVFGLTDNTRNISNAQILRNVFVGNGAQQTSEDNGEVAFEEYGSTGTCADNIFYSDDPSTDFVFKESREGTLKFGWKMENNTIHSIGELHTAMADTPAIESLTYKDGGKGAAHVVIKSNHYHPSRPSTVLWSIDGSWPQLGVLGTTATSMTKGGKVELKVPRTAALNVRFLVEKLLPSLTTTLVVPVPATDALG